MAEKERVKEYEIAFIAKLLDSEVVQRGIEELGKKTERTGEKAKSFFADIRKFIPDLGIFNKLLGAIGIGGLLSFGGLVSMMPEANAAMIQLKYQFKELARFLGPKLAPAFQTIVEFFGKFIQKIIDAENKYGIIGKIANAFAAVLKELIRLEEKYDIIDTIAGLADAAFDFTIEVAKYIDDILPEWLKDALLVGTLALSLTVGLGSLPFTGIAGLAAKLGIAAITSPAGIVTLEILFTLGAITKLAGDLDKALDELAKVDEDTMDKVPGWTGVFGRGIYKGKKWIDETTLLDKVTQNPITNPIGFGMAAQDFTLQEIAKYMHYKTPAGYNVIVDDRGRFLRLEPDTSMGTIAGAGGG